MLVLLYILNLLAPIVNFVGLLGLCGCIVYEDLHILVISGIMAVVGLVLGLSAYKYDIAPRMFWVKSINQIFSFSVTAVLGYAWSMAMWPCAVYMVTVLVDATSKAA